MKFYYYVDKEGVRQGPLPLEDIAIDEIQPETLVWCKGMKNWEKAKNVDDLCFLFPTLNKSEIASDTQHCNTEVQTSNDKECIESDGADVDVSDGDNNNHRVCTYCGCLVEKDAQFCSECGHKIGKASNTQLINDVIDDDEHKSKKKTWTIIAVILILAFSLIIIFFLSSRQSTNGIGDSTLDADSAQVDTVSNIQEVETSTVTYSFKTIKKKIIMKTIEPDENGEYQYCSKSLKLRWPFVDGMEQGTDDLPRCLIHFLFDDKSGNYVANGTIDAEIKHYLSSPSFLYSDYTEHEVISDIPDDASYTYCVFIENELKLVMQSKLFISFSLESLESAGGPHPDERTLYLNYNKFTNTPMTLYDVFKDPNGGRLLSIINDQLKKKYSGRDNSYDAPKANEVPQKTWCIGKNGILVHFNAYDIGSWTEGAFDVQIPYRGYEDMFTDNFLRGISE